MGLADGPTEVHKVTVARQVLSDYRPSDGLWPTEHLPEKLAEAPGEVRRVPRARGREPVTDSRRDDATTTAPRARRPERLGAGWTRSGLPGAGAPVEHRFISGGA